MKINNIQDSRVRIMLINYPCKWTPVSIPLLSLGYLGTYSKSYGCDVNIIDSNFYLRPYSIDDLIGSVKKFRPHLIGITLFTQSAIYGYEFLKSIKSAYNDCLYVSGGPHSTILPKEALDHGFDIACRGEGEKTIVNLIKYVQGTFKLKEIDGITFYDENNRLISNKEVELENNLDSLQTVDYDIYDRLYFSEKNKNAEFAIFSSRGCPSKCTFCNSYGVFGSRYRYRSSDNVLYELELLNKKYGVRRINFVDDYFTLNKQRVSDICESIIKKELKIEWGAYSKAGGVPKDLLDLMKKAGCTNLAYGIENIYPKTLELINKKTSIESIYRTYQNTSCANIPFKTNIMAGFPWETKESVKTNIDFILRQLRRRNNVRFNLSVLYPIPSTKLYDDYVEKFPQIRETWLNKNLMDMWESGSPLEVNLFNLDKTTINEIKFMKFIISKIPQLNTANRENRKKFIIIWLFRKILYYYAFLKIFYYLIGKRMKYSGKL